jgi:predicted RNA-binding protein (virulence factor B family)
MLKVGRYNNFKVVKGTNRGWYIEEAGETLFVPKKTLPAGTQVGYRVKLFVYNKGKDQIRATKALPLAQLDEFAYLRVKEVAPFGIFLDWGIDKDLFVPKRFLKKETQPGDSVVVRLIPDEESRSVIASCLLDDYILDKPGKELKVNQQANILIYAIKDLGFRVIINNKYKGMLYKDDNSHKIHFGEKRQGYISKIRPDGLIDVSLE